MLLQKGCPRPTAPESGFVKGYQPSQPLTSVTYHCQPGFELPRHEVNQAECQISGEWSPGNQAYCDSKYYLNTPHMTNNAFV